MNSYSTCHCCHCKIENILEASITFYSVLFGSCALNGTVIRVNYLEPPTTHIGILENYQGFHNYRLGLPQVWIRATRLGSNRPITEIPTPIIRRMMYPCPGRFQKAVRVSTTTDQGFHKCVFAQRSTIHRPVGTMNSYSRRHCAGNREYSATVDNVLFVSNGSFSVSAQRFRTARRVRRVHYLEPSRTSIGESSPRQAVRISDR